jgi:hypothetical protein
MQTTINDLINDKTYDRDALDKWVTSTFSEENKQTWLAYAAAYNYICPN